MISILISILVCVLAGWLTGQLMRGRGYGLLGDLILGLVGGWFGYFLVNLLHLPIGSGLISRIIVMVLGASLLVALVRMLSKR